jgi:hypothetical protein
MVPLHLQLHITPAAAAAAGAQCFCRLHTRAAAHVRREAVRVALCEHLALEAESHCRHCRGTRLLHPVDGAPPAAGPPVRLLRSD